MSLKYCDMVEHAVSKPRDAILVTSCACVAFTFRNFIFIVVKYKQIKSIIFIF